MPLNLALTHIEVNNAVVRRQVAPPPIDVTPPPPPPPPPTGQEDRSGLVAGTYKPSATTTGLLANTPTYTTLTGDRTISTAGTTYTNTIFMGKVSVATTDVTLRNCSFRGTQANTIRTAGDSSQAMLQCTNAAVKRLLIEDCEFKPTFPSNVFNGILGHDFTVRRSNFTNCSDGIGCYNAADHTAINVVVEANYIHDLWFVIPSDTGTRPEGTHNDCMQFSGGQGYRVVGNSLQCFIDPASQVSNNPHYPYLTGTGCVTVTPVTTGTGSGTSAIAMSDILIDRNYMDGGGSEVNISEGPTGTSADVPIKNLKITNNQFGRNRRPDSADAATVIGYVTSTTRADSTYSYTGNVWEDGAGGTGPNIANG